MNKFKEEYMNEHKDRDLESNWKAFKGKISEIMELHVPSKKTSIRQNLPWLNHTLKRMVRKKQRMYNKAKRTHKNEDWDIYNKHKKNTLKALKRA